MLITDDFLMMLIFFFMTVLIIGFMRRAMTSSRTSSSNASGSSAAKPQAVPKNQMAEDIKATKTSQVADAVSILDDLGSTSSNYRHYCELVGTSMASSGVIAPYSKREVAYYDIKCYRIDARYGGGQEETLIAHEHSFDPFFFTDASCDKPVYIDLESFGDNVILVNSTNHIEGPNSEFAKAVGESTSSSTGRSGTAYAMVGHRASRLGNVLRGAAHALRDALSPRSPLQPAYALADGGELPSAEAPQVFDHVKFDKDDRDGSRGHGGRGPQQRPRVTIQLGGYGNVMPPHLGDFMGPSHQPYVMGGGFTTHRPVGPSSSDILLGMSLGALLNSMTTTQQQVVTPGSTNTFRGYRLVENVVPLGSPIYCIGEVYRHGTDVYMGRSLAKDYPTSFFATKPEAEVLSAIGAL